MAKKLNNPMKSDKIYKNNLEVYSIHDTDKHIERLIGKPESNNLHPFQIHGIIFFIALILYCLFFQN